MSAITLDEERLRAFEKEAERTGVPLAKALRAALRNSSPTEGNAPAYVLPTFEMGVPTVDLTKALALAAELDDEAFIERAGRVK